jgi:glycogen(starch) synthase
MKRAAIRWSCGKAARVVTASGELADVVASVGVPKHKIMAVPNAIWPHELASVRGRQESRTALNIPADAFVVMMLRRLVPKTGVQYAIRAIPHCIQAIPNLRLVVLGDGPLRTHLMSLAHSLHVSSYVDFVGSVDNALVPRYLPAADLGLFPSLAEATSVAALEFMAAGIPVAASTVGGLPEIITHGETGFLFDIGFSHSRYDDPGLPPSAILNIANAITTAARSDLRAIGTVAAVRVRAEFSWDSYAARLERQCYSPQQ